MEYESYRKAYFVQPAPEARFQFNNAFGTTLFYEDYNEAVAYYERVLGPAAYVEGDDTRGWPIGNGWLTLLRGKSGNPTNVEMTLELDTAEVAEALQQEFIDAGGKGPAPSDQLMYRPVHSCPVTDPFGMEILIIAAR